MKTNTVFSSFEPKVSNRFVLEFPQIMNIPDFATFKISPLIHHPKDDSYEPMTIYMHDPIDPSTSYILNNGLRALRKEYPSNTMVLTLKSLGPVGDVVEEWVIEGSIDYINYGSYDRDDETGRVIEMGFDVNSAIHNY